MFIKVTKYNNVGGEALLINMNTIHYIGEQVDKTLRLVPNEPRNDGIIVMESMDDIIQKLKESLNDKT